MHFGHRLVAVVSIVSAIIPQGAFAEEHTAPYEQEFILTAYYSPLPDQCCYVKGSYEADKILNGEGTHGADGTAVYPGMLAAPPTYAFGTRISLPGLGIMTVHDRGGAIQEWTDAHRLDVWAGAGEEGLARALAFGVQEIRGTVYPVGTTMPAESFVLESLPAPQDRLKPYLVSPDAAITNLHPALGQKGLGVSLLQERLTELGYFSHPVTGLYGEITKQSIVAFNGDMDLSEPGDTLTETTAAYLEAAVQYKDSQSNVQFTDTASTPSVIRQTQRTMRSLGFYKGRTNGVFDEALRQAIIAYQKSQGLVVDASSPGAGRIGPLTKAAIDKKVRTRRIKKAAEKYIVMNRVRKELEKKDLLINITMQEGKSGEDVRLLQAHLAKKGFFPADKINGNYGPLTAEAVARYQVRRGLLASTKEKGAGTIGPVTLGVIRQEQVKEMYTIVQSKGWSAL